MTPGESAVVQQARRRLSRHGALALGAMLVPAVSYPLGLFLLRDDARFAWLGDVRAYPWELWAIAACGTAATLGVVLDWFFHRCGEPSALRTHHPTPLLEPSARGHRAPSAWRVLLWRPVYADGAGNPARPAVPSDGVQLSAAWADQVRHGGRSRASVDRRRLRLARPVARASGCRRLLCRR